VQSEFGSGYLLAFAADKTSGKVTSIIIIPTVPR
jgi:hypothetical protein